jgi:hypothetical protein
MGVRCVGVLEEAAARVCVCVGVGACVCVGVCVCVERKGILSLSAAACRFTLRTCWVDLFSQGFFFAVFGSRLVSPVFGDGMVGTISIGFGVTNMVASLLLGRLTDSWGWPGPLAAGLVAHVRTTTLGVKLSCAFPSTCTP